MAERPAHSLSTLRAQVNSMFPGRSKVSDGWIGDRKHASRKSDHNPDAKGVVHALDLTHDPSVGMDARKLAEALVASRDPRISYIISNGQIIAGTGGNSPWRWRKYTGANPHTKHVHISVHSGKGDDPAKWSVTMDKTPTGPKPVARPLLKRGSKGADVKTLQTLLRITADGIFGKGTETAVIAFQRANKLHPDGKVGAYTWDALDKAARPKAAPNPPAARASAAGLIPTATSKEPVMASTKSVVANIVVEALKGLAADRNVSLAPKDVNVVARQVTEAVAPVVQHATNTEPWYQKRSRWSAIIGFVFTVATPLLTKYGLDVSAETQEFVVTVCSTAGGLIASYLAYRAGTAKKPLGA